MTSRPDLQEQAAAYVLGALEAKEARAFEARLDKSPALQREVEELREVAALLPLAGEAAPRDDDALKARLLERIRRRPREVHRPARVPLLWVGWAAAAAAAVAVGVQQWRLGEARSELAALVAHADSVTAQLARREATLDHILEPGTALIQLTATGEAAPGVQMFWNATARRVVLHAYNLPPAPDGRAYQLWFLGDGAPVPGGTFNSEADGHALVSLDGPPVGVTFAGAAVTEEPAGGSTAPTTAVIVAGMRSE